ncbi:MAG: hypothetical protein LW850_34345 [Planctomycetaceae bacterium]|nr:hypothetical protein [Planctomycetaceae bacterium]
MRAANGALIYTVGEDLLEVPFNLGDYPKQDHSTQYWLCSNRIWCSEQNYLYRILEINVNRTALSFVNWGAAISSVECNARVRRADVSPS